MEKSSSNMVRIMSHNIWGSFPRAEHSIANRHILSAGLYAKYKPDVIGMQECSVHSRSPEYSIVQLLKNDYIELDIYEDAKKEDTSTVFTPIFYKADKLNVIEKGFYQHDRAFNDIDSKSVCWAIFEHIESKHKFAVINTHFWWVKETPEDEAARVANAENIIKTIQQIKHNYDMPIVAMGDLNCNIHSDAFTYLLEHGMKNARDAAKNPKDISTHHPYPELNLETGLYHKGVYPLKTADLSIDHILITEDYYPNVVDFEVVDEMDSLNASDHCPIYIDFVF